MVVLVTLVTHLATLGLSSRPAFAHAELVSSDPAPGAVLDAAPAAVILEFSEAIEIGLAEVRLFDGSGERVDVGAAGHGEGGNLQVAVDLPDLANGSYVVDWQVVSSDSHPIHGAYSFQVGPESDLERGILEAIIGADRTARPAGIALTVSRGLMIAAMAVVLGGLAVLGLGVVDMSGRVRRVLIAGSITGAVVGLLQWPLAFGYAKGRSLGVVFDGDAWSATFDSFGTGWVVRAVIIGIAGAALTLTAARRSRPWWRISTVAATIAIGVASAYGGHGAAGRWIPVGVVATAAHVAAMAVWLGGLAMLLLELPTARVAGVRRFSNLAAAMIATVVVSGVVQSFRELGSFDALTGTNYGTLLIWKVILVVLMTAIAALSRRVVRGRLLAFAPDPDISDTDISDTDISDTDIADIADIADFADVEGNGVESAVDRPRLRRAVAVEIVIAVGIIVVTSLLMASNPSAAVESKLFTATLLDGDYLASITVEPTRVGPNELHLYLSSAASSLAQPDDLTVQISDPSRDVAAIDIEMARTGAGHFTAVAATFPYAATWTLTVTARYNEFEDVAFTTAIPIR